MKLKELLISVFPKLSDKDIDRKCQALIDLGVTEMTDLEFLNSTILTGCSQFKKVEEIKLLEKIEEMFPNRGEKNDAKKRKIQKEKTKALKSGKRSKSCHQLSIARSTNIKIDLEILSMEEDEEEIKNEISKLREFKKSIQLQQPGILEKIGLKENILTGLVGFAGYAFAGPVGICAAAVTYYLNKDVGVRSSKVNKDEILKSIETDLDELKKKLKKIQKRRFVLLFDRIDMNQ